MLKDSLFPTRKTGKFRVRRNKTGTSRFSFRRHSNVHSLSHGTCGGGTGANYINSCQRTVIRSRGAEPNGDRFEYNNQNMKMICSRRGRELSTLCTFFFLSCLPPIPIKIQKIYVKRYFIFVVSLATYIRTRSIRFSNETDFQLSRFVCNSSGPGFLPFRFCTPSRSDPTE